MNALSYPERWVIIGVVGLVMLILIGVTAAVFLGAFFHGMKNAGRFGPQPLAPPRPPFPDRLRGVVRLGKGGLTALIAGGGVVGLVFLITRQPVISIGVGAVIAFGVFSVQAARLRLLAQFSDEVVPTAKLAPPRGEKKGTLKALLAALVLVIAGSGVLLVTSRRQPGPEAEFFQLIDAVAQPLLTAGIVGGLVVLLWIVMKAVVSRKRLTATPTTPTPDPLLLTPDPTAVRGACPTCGHAIPAGSPLGLCPRCLIRGAMPSPTATRWRSVSPIEPPSPAEVGEFFPHLEVLELIGAGGMGAVYKARQPHLDRLVALKIVQSPRGDDDPVFAERFAREARAMAKLDHPNIVTIHESGEVSGLPFLVMEYVDGVTLREAMVNRLLTAPEALAVIPQVCDALDYAHANGIVHRDIKPENILLDQTGRVKIADFGLAKLADPKNVTLTRTQQAMGTPHYMAPEQWERPNEVDHRADIYAVGVVLYELLTGELPLGRFALPSEKGKGDARLDRVVIRALAKEPGERYQRAGEMKGELSGVSVRGWDSPPVRVLKRGFEYRSRTTFLGLPLVHVVANGKGQGQKLAVGWIAVGDVGAVGGVAVGGVFAVGGLALGGVISVGLIAVGGALAIGGAAAAGAVAFGFFALGGALASGPFALGGAVVAP